MTLLYGLICGVVMFLLAEQQCGRLYPDQPIVSLMRRFALLVPMLYCDLIADAMTKGLGQQAACARYSIISNLLDVGLMFFLLPRYGIDGYFFSFALTHGVNFALSLRRILRIGTVRCSSLFPALTLGAAVFAVFGGSFFTGPIRRTAAFLGLFFGLCFYTGALGKGDLRWLQSQLYSPGKTVKKADATNG